MVSEFVSFSFGICIIVFALVCTMRLLCKTVLVALHSGRKPVFDRRTFPVPRSTYSWRVTTYVGKPSAVTQPTRPTQPFILLGSINWVVTNPDVCWSRRLVSVHEVEPVRLSIATRRMWLHCGRLSELLYIVSCVSAALHGGCLHYLRFVRWLIQAVIIIMNLKAWSESGEVNT